METINQEVVLANAELWNELQKRRNILLRSGCIQRTNLTNHFQYTFSDENIKKEFYDICNLMADLASACISKRETIIKSSNGQMIATEDINEFNDTLVELQNLVKVNNASGKIFDPTYDEGSYEIGTTNIDSIIERISTLTSSNLREIINFDEINNLLAEIYILEREINDSLEHASLAEHLRIYQSGMYDKFNELIVIARPIAINQAKNCGVDSVSDKYETEFGPMKSEKKL